MQKDERQKEKKAHRIEMARLQKENAIAVEKDVFLSDWLAQAELVKSEFYLTTRQFNQAQRQVFAKERGYRTWSQLLATGEAVLRVHHLFVKSEGFRNLWAALKEDDSKMGWVNLYGPHNGGVPLRLLRAVQEWHELPKFTRAERAKQCKKIIQLCDELTVLVGQLTPSTMFGDPFKLPHITGDQASRLMKSFESPESMASAKPTDPSDRVVNRVRYALEHGGIDAFWCIKNIEIAASQEPMVAKLPTKIRAKSAYKTFLVIRAHQALWFNHGPLRGLHQLIADVVAEITESDCSAEDVRKAIASQG